MSLWQKSVDYLRDLFERGSRFYRSSAVILVVSVSSALICQNPFQNQIPNYSFGDISKRNVKAPKNLRVLDESQTDEKRDVVSEKIPDVFDFDARSIDRVMEKVTKAFNILHSMRADRQKERAAVNSAFGFDIPEDDYALIHNSAFQKEIEKTYLKELQSLKEYWISEDGSLPSKFDAMVRDIETNSETKFSREAIQKKLVSLEQARDLARTNEKWRSPRFSALPPVVRAKSLSLLAKLIEANFVYNQVETDARRDEVRSKVEPAVAEITEGEMIVREGQRVERRDSLLLKELRAVEKKDFNLGATFLFAFLIAFLIRLFYVIGMRNFKKFKLSFKDQLVTGGFFIASLGFLAGFNYLLAAAKAQSVGGLSLLFLLPMAFPGMTLRLFTSMEIVTFFSILFNLCLAWMLKDPYLGLVGLASGLAGASWMRHIGQRLDVFKAGAISGCVQGILIVLGLGMNLTDLPGYESSLINISLAVLCSMAAGLLLCSSFTLGIQPLLEYLGYTTDLRLMELSSTNHPLLRDMVIKAPGTYFHSFTVSQLAEKAAEAIHANALFARVASLYHDIGKVRKPHYFIENIKGENKHDKLVPTMSALIISNHVKDGIELGLQFKLPQSIIEIIPQHHGTSLISYFYDKAKKQGSDEPVDEHDFRYAGPKPQTREGAIILLADAVEATAKALVNKSQDQLRQAVHQTIQRFFLDGQLDECELSLKDLTAIGNAFLQVLQGVYHQRIDYPHLTKDAQTQNETEKENGENQRVLGRISSAPQSN